MSIVVDLVLDGKNAVTGGLQDVATALRDLQKSLNAFNRSAGNIGKASNGAAQAINNQATAASKATGVMSRLIKAQQDYNKAVQGGNAVSITDAHANLLRAQKNFGSYLKQANPQQPKTQTPQWASYLGNLIGTTRVGVGKFAPLLGRMIPGGSSAIAQSLAGMVGGGGGAAGMAGAAGPVGLAVAATVAVFKGLADAAKAAASMLNQFGSARASTGASYASLGQGMGIAGALGMSPEEYAQAASQFADGASHGGYAEFDARRMGVNVSPNSYERSNQDVMAEFNKAVRYILNTGDDKGAMAMARRNPALQAAYEARGLSDGTKKQVMDSFTVSPEDVAAAKEFQVQQNLIARSWQKIVLAIGKPVLDAMAPLMADISKSLDQLPKGGISMFVKGLMAAMPIFGIVAGTIKLLAWWTNAWSTAMDFLAKKIIAFIKMINPAWGARADKAWNQYKNGGDGKSGKDSLDANTHAVNQNTRELKNQREVLGGGQRSRGALPAAWRYQQLDAAMHSNAARLGAF